MRIGFSRSRLGWNARNSALTRLAVGRVENDAASGASARAPTPNVRTNKAGQRSMQSEELPREMAESGGRRRHSRWPDRARYAPRRHGGRDRTTAMGPAI